MKFMCNVIVLNVTSSTNSEEEEEEDIYLAGS